MSVKGINVGNVRVTFSVIKMPTETPAQPFMVDLLSRSEYYPYGMKINDLSYNAVLKRGMGYNSQEQSTELNLDGNHTTAEFWEYDTRSARRWNNDPRPVTGISPYATFQGNPIMFSDMKGDSSVVDKKGDIIYYDKNDKDKRVFLLNKGKQSLLGSLGGQIDANTIYSNLLNENINESEDILNPLTFKDLVKTNGDWDIKNDKGNKDGNKNDKGSIFGIGNDGRTKFLFQGKEMESQDLGNHHFGAVALAYGLFPSEEFILRKAGEYQILSGTSKPEWQPSITVKRFKANSDGNIFEFYETVKTAPYGDDPRDQGWIKSGFKYYKTKYKKK